MDPGSFSRPVERRDLGAVDAPAGTALEVSFSPGARTRWHRHPGGQVLYVLEGRGRVGVRNSAPVEIGAGDLVSADRDEEHWHGATEDTPMTHLVLSFGDMEMCEPVDDD